MRTRTAWVFALGASILLVVAVWPGAVHADPVVSYGGPFDLPIPADSDATK